VLIDHLSICIAIIFLEHEDSSKIVELAENGVSILVHSSPELTVFAKTNFLIVNAPVVEIIFDHAHLTKVSVLPVKVNKVVGSCVSILNRG